MADQITTFQEEPQHTQQVTLAGEELRLRLTYRERTASWYIDAFAVDGTPIVLGRRISGGWLPFEGLALRTVNPGLPDEIVFFAQGPSDYLRESLGDTLLLFAYTEEELAAARAVPTGDAVTVAIVP